MPRLPWYDGIGLGVVQGAWFLPLLAKFGAWWAWVSGLARVSRFVLQGLGTTLV